MKVTAVIPARLESTRLYRKLLLAQTGKTLLQHTYENLIGMGLFDNVLVAAEQRPQFWSILDDMGADYVLTGEHPNGTSRIAEAILGRDDELIVNVQGDEPEVRKPHLEELISIAMSIPTCDIATLATHLTSETASTTSAVKVTIDEHNRAIDFSRAYPSEWRSYHHLGIYAYSAAFVKWYASMPPTKNEQLHKLEQLRALDLGATIRVGIVHEAMTGIDTEAEYAAFMRRQGCYVRTD